MLLLDEATLVPRVLLSCVVKSGINLLNRETFLATFVYSCDSTAEINHFYSFFGCKLFKKCPSERGAS